MRGETTTGLSRTSRGSALVLLLAAAGASAQDAASEPSEQPQSQARQSAPMTAATAAAELEELARGIELARDNIDLVEKQHTLREEPSDDAARLQRFSDGEIQYLLGDYANASVLFYDLVANKDFQASPRYADALFYLADALYQQKNYLGARLYLRQLLNLRQTHYKEALSRYLEIAGRLNEFVGIDEYLTQARTLSGGQLAPDLSYVYAKWLFRREDQPASVRVPRAQQVFQTLVTDTAGPFRTQAAYYIGVGYVKLQQYDQAIDQFKRVAALTPTDERDKSIQELVNLSLGRVYFELGRFDEAIDRYAQIPQQSSSFPDALYEIAWAYVRKGELANAKNATDILLMVAEDSVLAPEAKILQGTLLQKLQRYDDSVETYTEVINTYAPVRDEMDALLTANQDPVKYFDELLARNERTLDVTRLLPPIALKWAGTRREVAEAQGITGALDSGRRGLIEARQISERILKSLAERGLESFPMLQEGYARADAVETAITRSEARLTRLVEDLSGDKLTPERRRRLADLRAREQQLKARIDTLPTSTDEIRQRRERMQASIDGLDRQAFRAGLEIQSQQAQLIAIRRYVDDTRAQRKSAPDEEHAFLDKVTSEQRALDGMQAELEELRSRLKGERANADKAVSGEDVLRREYTEQLNAQRAILDEGRGSLSTQAQNLIARADVVRVDAQAVRDRVGRAKGVIRERVERRAEKLRGQVLAEQRLIESYQSEADSVTGDTRNLVGRIAFESFKRVRQSFYDLVLKADVGVVDVAFQRKQDKTSSIQRLASQKDRELKGLDGEFQEVMKDVQ